MVSEIENNRIGANLAVPTPMGHLAKIKILEYGTIGCKQMDRALCTYNIVSFVLVCYWGQ